MALTRAAAIDIGTNTILLLCAEVEGGAGRARIRTVLHDEQTIVRLGQGVAKARAFAPEAMDRALECLRRAAARCRELGIDPAAVRAVATSASRDAANASEFYGRVREETGIEVSVIEGETEARYSFLGGLLDGQDPLATALIDIGGGSTEFVVGRGSRADLEILGRSVDMGCVRATELFLPDPVPSVKQLERLEAELHKHWSSLDPGLAAELRRREWTGVAGTVTTLAGVALDLPAFSAERMHGYRLDRCVLGDLYESLALQSGDQRSAHPLIGKGRADVIVAGAAILLSAMEHFDRPDVAVSIRGLRYGALMES